MYLQRDNNVTQNDLRGVTVGVTVTRGCVSMDSIYTLRESSLYRETNMQNRRRDE